MVDQEENPPLPEETFESAESPKQVLITDEELKSLHNEVLEYKDKYLRLLADADNTRKRLQKEREEINRYAIESIIVDLLSPLDNLENALRFAQEMSDEVRNWAFGFQMIFEQFKDIMTQKGITPFKSEGEKFNPQLHEAIEAIESDEHPAGIVIEECVKGYKMGDRVIRPARVKVTKSKENVS
jgi:molecular chaperone GrpE